MIFDVRIIFTIQKETEGQKKTEWQNDKMNKKKTEEDRMTKGTKETEWQKRQNKKNGRTEGDLLCIHDFIIIENWL